MAVYAVTVEALGSVYVGVDEALARATFQQYVWIAGSEAHVHHAGYDQEVVLWWNGQRCQQYRPPQPPSW